MSKTLPFVIFFYISSFLLFLSSNHWFLLWISVELTTLTFIPLMNDKSKTSIEAIVTYFLIQAISSILLIFGFLQNQILIKESQIFNTCLIALMVKLSVAPLHSWFPPIMAKMSTTPMTLLLTFQKLQPFLLLFLSNSKSKLFFLFVVATCVMGSVSNMMQNNIKMILAYSSISHGGWLLMALWTNKSIWIIYMFIYFVTIFLIWKMFIPNLTQAYYKSNMKSFWSVLMLSLAGMPPLIGFYPKMMIVSEMASMTLFLMICILMMTATIDFFIYTRTFYMSFYNRTAQILWTNPLEEKSSTLAFLMFGMLSVMVML
uniref:NADH-ubiquinone oxidoreductase chain 2 n=1 Tax=Hypsibius dujardini TaxID=232323 RepID=E7BBB6_HYPDU|nr:NADH dehydrogenase subunit 2 [Hypsibius dujardini]CBY83897.1 NADH dehydogenase subunit 2 [Hypsibius dujardini]